MIEWFENIWAWIMSNKDNIVTIVSGIDFTATAAVVFALIKTVQSFRKNTASNNGVSTALRDVKFANESVNSLKGDVSDVKTELLNNNKVVEVYNKELSDIKETFKDFVITTESKFNALMEVQSLVYSTIKDDTIRKSVQNVINNAKHNASNAKTELVSDISKLKSEMQSKIEEFSSLIDKSQTKLKESAALETSLHEENSTQKENSVTRY